MKFRKIILLILLLAPCAKAGSFDELINSVREYCPTAKELAVKKAVIEINAKADCSGTFTTAILKDCNKLVCSQFSSIVTNYISGNSGTIIGKK